MRKKGLLSIYNWDRCRLQCVALTQHPDPRGCVHLSCLVADKALVHSWVSWSGLSYLQVTRLCYGVSTYKKIITLLRKFIELTRWNATFYYKAILSTVRGGGLSEAGGWVVPFFWQGVYVFAISEPGYGWGGDPNSLAWYLNVGAHVFTDLRWRWRGKIRLYCNQAH